MRCGVTCVGEAARPQRERFGCDGPAKANDGQGWATPCWSCDGKAGRDGKEGRPLCRWCLGLGRVAFTRCVGHLVGTEHFAVVDACEWARERGILPLAGGRLDQTRTFVLAADLVDAEDAACHVRHLKSLES